LSDQLNAFDAAVTAFEIRLAIELSDRWEKLESDAGSAAILAPFDEKRSALDGFFENAEKEVSSVVHEYFPRLLQVATVHRQHLGNKSPLAWTESLVLKKVCDFLGVDEKFDHTSPSRDGSRLLVAAVYIALGIGWGDEPIPADFVLPGWLSTDWLMRRALVPASFRSSADDAESLPPLSRAETIKWIKQREFWMSKRIERQIGNDSWDGIIDAGKSDVSVLDAFIAPKQQSSEAESIPRLTEPEEDRFLRETTTWLISLGDETCRVKPILGLDYISLLLENPGKAIRALQLLSRAGGRSKSSSALPAAGLSEDCNAGERLDAQRDRSSGQRDFIAHELLDDQARRELAERQLELERDITYKFEMGDNAGAEKLLIEHSTIQSYLKSARGVQGRPRVFSGENEKARVSITHALNRAYEDIQEQAPKIAAHLKSNITKGSEFTYRDASRSWKVRRTP